MTETMDPATGELVPGAHPPMPAKIAAAIVEVMKAVPRLGKGEKNQHGNYNFASVDDFLEAVRPLCAKHGLIILQDEDMFDMREGGTDKNGKPVVWVLMRFRFTLAHESGETWAHQPTRSVMVNASMGSQAFGAAQSYALKNFERALFQIATGEKDGDADAHPPANLPPRKAAPKRSEQKAPPPPAAAANGANGASKPTVDVPDEPGAIPVPVPEGENMDGAWAAWAEAFARIIKVAEIDDLAAWMAANEQRVQNLATYSNTGRKWAERLRGLAKERHEAVTQGGDGNVPF